MTDVEAVAIRNPKNASKILGIRTPVGRSKKRRFLHLLKITKCLVGVESTFTDEIVEQFPSFGVLHDEISSFPSAAAASFQPWKMRNLQLVSRLPHVENLENVRMLDQLHDHNLALDAKQHLIRLRDIYIVSD
jgi:hypothetical protein